ncbi:aldose epimerase [bacterium M00.F.Ca.ET.228.01.1.1]|uniref:aldose epimerase family protein n=1 Tax=Paraburkholderia phenoliruptrix TaxID=252970 RepID=UPI001092A306|nr:aldose epimerase [Paraburkholderia phenoliruptrix]TGP43688.1 aldose epimerase [bacterium M00.F.Ca.ET.228.01.1.1]TGS01350.1 aldose epimerase [bacterium M00.F.Ca.ET.191.01.1.1]TGU09044.1 aldose epimerase [bacterium M00.F.Ca.ET.155.01.1.1]MBW0449437.1 aldose epimerase [Paraburkholderia phenoliruptrix]MBW9097718.1 aldose epimerase [Paraburkholderia phenoliruptrix]
MPLSPQQDILEIAQDASVLRFAPQAGGRLLSWIIDGEEVIHWPEHADWSQPARIRGGNPLLFPFLGRHRVDGKIGYWRDAQGTVRELPMHGFARDLPFDAHADVHGAGLRLVLTDSEATRGGYPFGFRFEAAYTLIDARTLEVTLTTTNTGDAALPYYAGHHFYFTLPHTQRAATSLELPPTARRFQQADGSISAAEPGEARYTLDEARIHDRFHCLTGVPSQPVKLTAPGLDRVITIDLNRPDSVPWYAVTTWTEAADSDFYCVEPWLGLPDAIHNGMGLRWLEPGKTEVAALRIQVTKLR